MSKSSELSPCLGLDFLGALFSAGFCLIISAIVIGYRACFGAASNVETSNGCNGVDVILGFMTISIVVVALIELLVVLVFVRASLRNNKKNALRITGGLLMSNSSRWLKNRHNQNVLIGAVAVGAVLICLFAANFAKKAPLPSDTPATQPPSNTFQIVAESEVKSLQDAGILSEFTKETGIETALTYRGPVDIQAAIAKLKNGSPGTVDAYWPGSSLWLPGSSDVEPQSVMKTYVVLAVDPDTAKSLGWDSAKGISASDLVSAIQSDQIKLAMTSASQSTPGAAFYLAMYTALTGERVLTSDSLDNPQAVDGIKTLLEGVDRSAGSIDHLKEIFVNDKISGANQYNAIIMYESLAIQMNNELIARLQQPMVIFYVDGATAIADAPIRYVDNGYDAKLEQYNKLVEFLRRPEIQQRIQALGWRTTSIGMALENADPSVFNTAWGIDTTTEFREMVFPKPHVSRAALFQYQALFRKPSFTVYCLDYSGSMRNNNGLTQMIDAMDLLLDQERASAVLLQATPEDVTLVYGFADTTSPIGSPVEGNDPEALKNLSGQIATSNINGGTAMFDCVKGALDYIASHLDSAHSFSVIAMTDGESNQGLTAADFDAYYRNKKLNIPVYGIAFGTANFSQMNVFQNTGGAVYDGREDIALAFRQAKGNN